MVDKFKNNYEKKINELNEEINLFKKFYEGIKENMDKANQKVLSFKLDDAMDRITFSKINELNVQVIDLINKFGQCDVSNFKKLEEENEILKEQKAVSEEMKKILSNKTRLGI